jgi:hypothetical protein
MSEEDLDKRVKELLEESEESMVPTPKSTPPEETESSESPEVEEEEFPQIWVSEWLTEAGVWHPAKYFKTEAGAKRHAERIRKEYGFEVRVRKLSGSPIETESSDIIKARPICEEEYKEWFENPETSKYEPLVAFERYEPASIVMRFLRGLDIDSCVALVSPTYPTLHYVMVKREDMPKAKKALPEESLMKMLIKEVELRAEKEKVLRRRLGSEETKSSEIKKELLPLGRVDELLPEEYNGWPTAGSKVLATKDSLALVQGWYLISEAGPPPVTKELIAYFIVDRLERKVVKSDVNLGRLLFNRPELMEEEIRRLAIREGWVPYAWILSSPSHSSEEGLAVVEKWKVV